LKHLTAHIVSNRFPELWLKYRTAFRKHQFEKEYWLAPLFCRPDKIAIDVGASVGEYSYALARTAKAVIAFEPNPALRRRFQRLNGSRVRLENVALSDRNGTAELRYIEEASGFATIERRNRLESFSRRDRIKTRIIETRTLDSFGFSDVSFIKIDVEGHEESVLGGADQTVSRNMPVLLIESENRHAPGAPGRVTQRLTGRGYAGFFIKNRKLLSIAAIQDEDRDASNLSVPGKSYINNYFFIPADRNDLLELLRAGAENP
jgi:FkbM family methyltransferase